MVESSCQCQEWESQDIGEATSHIYLRGQKGPTLPNAARQTTVPAVRAAFSFLKMVCKNVTKNLNHTQRGKVWQFLKISHRRQTYPSSCTPATTVEGTAKSAELETSAHSCSFGVCLTAQGGSRLMLHHWKIDRYCGSLCGTRILRRKYPVLGCSRYFSVAV
jgi:hypothetical protein